MIKQLVLYFLFSLSLTIKAQQSYFQNISFIKADAVARQYKGENLRSLPILAYNLTNTLSTDIEKFRAIYIWVCTNVENDYSFCINNKSGRKRLAKDSLKLATWNADFTKKTFKKLLKEQKTVCTGYAYLIKELANLVGIKCEIIDGYGRTTEDNIGELTMINHSWNSVQLNNKWYLCDATWSSGIYDLNNYKFVFDYNDGYFLANPDLFVKNHYPQDKKWLLTTKEISITDFLNGPIIYAEAFKQRIIPMQPTTMHLEIKQNEEITFVLKNTNVIDANNLSIEISSGTYKNSVKPNINLTKDGLLEVKHVFKNRGHYDFHLKLNNDYILTYTVKVKKLK